MADITGKISYIIRVMKTTFNKVISEVLADSQVTKALSFNHQYLAKYTNLILYYLNL